jgi:hypothetical protein
MEFTGGGLCGGTSFGCAQDRLFRNQCGEAHANRIRSFAACCGTHLFFEDTKDSDAIDVTIASLDDPTPFAPQKAIWLEDKLPWVVINELLPSFQKTLKNQG